MREPIRFHRFGLEIYERKFLLELRRLYEVHCRIIEAKKRAQPLVKFREIAFAEFTLELLGLGLQAMRLVLEGKDPDAKG